MNNELVIEYDKSVIEVNPIFVKNKDYIRKHGIAQFLKDIGIFLVIVPVLKSPNEKGELLILGFNIRSFDYRLNEMVDHNHFKMDYIEDNKLYPTIVEAGTSALLKAFELINSNPYFQVWIDKLY